MDTVYWIYKPSKQNRNYVEKYRRLEDKKLNSGNDFRCYRPTFKEEQKMYSSYGKDAKCDMAYELTRQNYMEEWDLRFSRRQVWRLMCSGMLSRVVW
jgi:hypothetical protein